MISIATIRKKALVYEGVEEKAHFEKTSFRIKNKIFLTLAVDEKVACLKLSTVDQSVFNAFDKTIFYAVPNAWGKQGWTYVNLKKVRKDMFEDALCCAFCEVAPKELKLKYKRT